MTQYRKLSAFIFTISAIVIVVFFQNCAGKSGSYSSQSTGTTNPTTWTTAGTPTIYHSSTPGFNTFTSFFNFNDTVYQKVKGLGATGYGCPEIVGQETGKCNIAANMISLAAIGWSYNSTTDEWTSHFPAQIMHGRTVRMVFRRSQTSPEYFDQTVSFQSVADASTSDVIFFMSLDPQGKNVIGADVKTSTAFYSHVKNGTAGSTYLCQWVKTNTNGTTNPNDPCAGTTPPTNPWVALPYETVSDSNTSMLTYPNPANTYHVTDVLNYLFKDGVKYGSFDSNFTSP